jgi:hypothetical protein
MSRHTSFASVALALGALLTIFCTPASAQLFGPHGLDPTFCQTRTVRQTVVYVDDSLLVEGKTEWVAELLRKLKASLAPGERTTVVQLTPLVGKSVEIWSGCWPQYTASQRVEIQKNGPYILKKDPLQTLPEQQGYFAQDFNAALSKIYFQAKRPLNAVTFAAPKAPQKQILRALASDEGRFSNSNITIRAIIYSGMAENSDLGSIFKPVISDASVDYAKKLGTHLRKAVFYVFGASTDIVDGPSDLEAAKAFWTNALRSMSAVVGGFGSDLNVPNGIPVSAWTYDVSLREGDQELSGKLSLMTDTDGSLVDSWIGFSRLDITGLTGTFSCPRSDCKLNADTTTSLVTNSPSETLVLSGPVDRLSGQLGVKYGKLSFPVTALMPAGK